MDDGHSVDIDEVVHCGEARSHHAGEPAQDEQANANDTRFTKSKRSSGVPQPRLFFLIFIDIAFTKQLVVLVDEHNRISFPLQMLP